MDGFGDGHIDAVFGCQIHDRSGGGDAFDDAHGLFDVLVEFGAFAERFAAGSVASFGAKAGGCQVACACDAEEGFGAGTHCRPKPGDFSEPAGKQGTFGVESCAEPVDDPGCDGDDIFGRSGEFDAQWIGVGVDAEPTRGKEFLDGLGESGVVRGGGHGRWEVAGEFGGDRGARHAPKGARFGVWVVVEDIGDDLGGAKKGFVFDALGDGDDRGVGGNQRGEAFKDGSHELDRDGIDEDINIFHGFGVA